MRELAAVHITPMLQQSRVAIRAFDPWARANAAALLPAVTWVYDPYAAAEDADLLLILTEWEMFRAFDLKRLATTMQNRIIFDCRNLLDPKEVTQSGFRYLSLGRTTVPRTVKRPHADKSRFAVLRQSAGQFPLTVDCHRRRSTILPGSTGARSALMNNRLRPPRHRICAHEQFGEAAAFRPIHRRRKAGVRGSRTMPHARASLRRLRPNNLADWLTVLGEVGPVLDAIDAIHDFGHPHDVFRVTFVTRLRP